MAITDLTVDTPHYLLMNENRRIGPTAGFLDLNQPSQHS